MKKWQLANDLAYEKFFHESRKSQVRRIQTIALGLTAVPMELIDRLQAVREIVLEEMPTPDHDELRKKAKELEKQKRR